MLELGCKLCHLSDNFDANVGFVAMIQELLTRHKSTVAEFLSVNYDWVFLDFTFHSFCHGC